MEMKLMIPNSKSVVLSKKITVQAWQDEKG
jgi:hypothetical protein